MYPSYRFAALFPINLNRGKTSLFFWPVMEWTSWLVSPKSVQENVLWPCEEERGDDWREGARFVGLSARWRSVRPAPSGVLISSTKGSQVDRMTSQIPPVVVKLFSESESDPSRQNTKHAWLLTGKSVFAKLPSSTCWKDCKHFPLRRNINFHVRVHSIICIMCTAYRVSKVGKEKGSSSWAQVQETIKYILHLFFIRMHHCKILLQAGRKGLEYTGPK